MLEKYLWSSLLIEVALACYQHIKGKQKPRFFVLLQKRIFVRLIEF